MFNMYYQLCILCTMYILLGMYDKLQYTIFRLVKIILNKIIRKKLQINLVK